MMDIHQLQKRYKKSYQEIEIIIQQHLGDFKDHAVYEKGMWKLDNEAVRLMDGFAGYTNYLPQKNETHKEEAMSDEPENENESADLTAKLQEALNASEERAEAYAKELSVLQEKFVEIQNGSEAINSSFIKKHQIRAETAEKELKKIQAKFQSDMQHKDERIKELESRIADMQEKLIANHDEIAERQSEINELSRKIESIKEEAAARCSKAELKVLESKRSEDKIYRDLHTAETKNNDLTQRLTAANDERSEALKKMAKMKSDLIGLKSKLIAITAEMKDYLTEMETIPDAGIVKEELALPEAEKEMSTLSPGTPVIPQTPLAISPIQDQRQELLMQLKQEQEAAKSESSGLIRSFFRRAAAMF